MFNPNVLLRAISPLWRDRFEDTGLLEALYGFTGTYLGDAYRASLEELSSLSLEYTPILRSRTWKQVTLSSLNRLHIPATAEVGESITLYGLEAYGEILDSCARVYESPSIDGENYLEATKDFTYVDTMAAEIRSIDSRFNITAFTSRFDRFVIFYGSDPFLTHPHPEPQDEGIYYPLVFELDKDYALSIGATASLVAGKEIILGYAEARTTSSILAVTEEGDSYQIAIDPSGFSPTDTDNDSITLHGIGTASPTVSLSGGYVLPERVIKVWAYDCLVDQLQLSRKFGHLIQPSASLMGSSTNYKDILRLFLRARLYTLSSELLEKLGDVVLGSSLLEFPVEEDAILEVNLVTNTLVTALTTYSLIPQAPISSKIINRTQRIITPSAALLRSQVCEVHISSAPTFTLLLQLLREGQVLTVDSFSDSVTGLVVCGTDRNSLVVSSATTTFILDADVKVIYLGTRYVRIPVGDITVTRLDDKVGLTENTTVNPQVIVEDLNTPGAWWQDVGLFLPRKIWDTPDSYRSEISTNTWGYKVGEMTMHRVGDYRLSVPSDVAATAPETAYLLFQDFLLTTAVVVRSRAGSTTSGTLDQVVNAVYRLLDLSKLLLPLRDKSLVDFVPIASDTLTVDMGVAPFVEVIPTVGTSGIGSLGYTILVEVYSAITISNVTGISIPDFGVWPWSGGDATVLGYQHPYLLLEIGSQSQAYSAGVSVSIAPMSVSGEVVYTTNHVGSESKVMAVGAAYPEYTKYYTFPSNTIAAHLNVAVEPVAMPITDTAGELTDSLTVTTTP
jgi:hypothetical protein